MVGAILTQNTNWQNVKRAIENIKKAKLLNPKALLKNQKLIPELIKPSGFYKLKSKRLIEFLKYYVKYYDGNEKRFKTKKTGQIRKELLSIHGVGYETADSILLYALYRPVFVVDAYTQRVFSRHKFFDHKLRHEEIRILFENNLPKETQLYNEYHALIVNLGKNYCKKNEPLCNICPLRNIFN